MFLLKPYGFSAIPRTLCLINMEAQDYGKLAAGSKCSPFSHQIPGKPGISAVFSVRCEAYAVVL
jgi:hypothetical protein